MSRYRGAALVAALVTAFAVAACGGSSSSTTTGSSSASTAASSSASPGSSSSGGQTTLTAAIVPVAGFTTFKIADDLGFFARHGIKIKYATAAPTGAEQLAQILNGQIDMGAGAFTGAMSAVAHGLPVQVVAATDSDFQTGSQAAYGTIVSKSSGITSFKGLDGKTVAVNSLQGNWQVSIQQAIKDAGGNPSTVKLVAIPFADQVTALKSGRVDAVSTAQPFIALLTAAGYRNLGDTQAIGFGGQQNTVVDTIFMSKKYTERSPTVVNNFVKALQEADDWANAHPAQTRTYIEQFTKTPANIVNATPIPRFTTHLGANITDEWNALMVKYGVLKQPVSQAQVIWSGAPL
jgi:NitT/TauT family transport system substrate-binding protein